MKFSSLESLIFQRGGFFSVGGVFSTDGVFHGGYYLWKGGGSRGVFSSGYFQGGHFLRRILSAGANFLDSRGLFSAGVFWRGDFSGGFSGVLSTAGGILAEGIFRDVNAGG